MSSLKVWIGVLKGEIEVGHSLHPVMMRDLEQDLRTADARCAALAKIVRQNVEWSGPDTGLCWDIVPNSNPCTHPGCIERRALIGEGT